jgi:hypothetical protein
MMCLSRNDLPMPHEPKMPIVKGILVVGDSMRSAKART